MIELLKEAQKRATKLIPTVRTRAYSECFKACKLPTLHYKHIRGDMIEMFKILSRKYDIAVMPWVNRCLLYTSPSPRDRTRYRMPSSA